MTQAKTNLWLSAVALALSACGRAPEPAAIEGDGPSKQSAAPLQVGPYVTAPIDTGELAGDPRIAELSVDCFQTDPYVLDTSDTLSILLRKLDRGDAEVLGRACEELGAMGARSVPALTRRLTEQINDPASVLLIQNTLRALGFNKDDGASDALVLALAHPSGSIRALALGSLSTRPLAAKHYDAVLDAAFYEGSIGQANAILAMWSADQNRAANQLIDWFAQDRIPTNTDIIGPLIAAIKDPDLLARLRSAVATAPPEYVPYIDVALDAAGDADAIDRTTQRFLHGTPDERARVLTGCIAAHQFEMVEWVAGNDIGAEMRALAVASLEPYLNSDDAQVSATAHTRLLAALDDASELVQQRALSILVRARDPRATDRALARLHGSRRDLEAVLPDLHIVMLDDPALAERARAIVEEELVRIEGNDPARDVHLLQALALCTGPRVVDRVLDAALAAPPATLIEGIRAHRFLSIQTANAGLDGRARLVERLADETDSARRIDLLWAIGSARDELARTALAAHLELDGIDPWERAYAAHLLAKIGPTSFAAPLIKAAARRVEGGARRAIDCLLWRWY